MDGKIMKFGELTEEQKKAAVELFMIGFGKFMIFSKDEELKRKLLLKIFDPALFFCYVEGDNVLGLMGLATNKKRPIYFDPDICKKYFGKFRGSVISRQMNAVFQSQAVKRDNELYLDTLVTGSNARRKGIGTKLLEYAFNLKEYNVMYTEVFSGNKEAISFYKKNGFSVDKEEKWSLLILQGAGYPIKMKKKLFSMEETAE